MRCSRLAAAMAAAFAPMAASAMAPMAADGQRDATWAGSPVSAQGPQTGNSPPASVTIIDMPVQAAAIRSGTTPVGALGRGLGRNIPADRGVIPADHGVAIEGRQIVSVAPIEQETWSRASPRAPVSPRGSQSSQAREVEAVGPQGWKGDLGDVMHSDDQQSMADDVGPQGWEREDTAQADDQRAPQGDNFSRSEQDRPAPYAPNDQPPGAHPKANWSMLM